MTFTHVLDAPPSAPPDDDMSREAMEDPDEKEDPGQFD